MKNIHFQSNSNEWSTPQDFFDTLNREFNFNVDVCANTENHKCPMWFSKEEDGLLKSWDKSRVWCNPPYGREIGKWVKKASEAMGGGSNVDTCSNRYKILPRIYLSEAKRRDTVFKRSIKIWWSYKFSTISKYGSNI
jgi:hypothetical protein